MGKINVAIVDDNERMVNLLEDILKEDADIEVVGKSENGIDALDMIKEKKINLDLLVSHRLPLDSFITALGMMTDKANSMKIIIEPNRV